MVSQQDDLGGLGRHELLDVRLVLVAVKQAAVQAQSLAADEKNIRIVRLDRIAGDHAHKGVGLLVEQASGGHDAHIRIHKLLQNIGSICHQKQV